MEPCARIKLPKPSQPESDKTKRTRPRPNGASIKINLKGVSEKSKRDRKIAGNEQEAKPRDRLPVVATLESRPVIRQKINIRSSDAYIRVVHNSLVVPFLRSTCPFWSDRPEEENETADRSATD